MTDKALEAARAAYRNAEENPRFVECPRCKGVGYHHGFGEDGNDPDWCSQCGGSQQIMPADEAGRPLIEAISAYLSALPGEAEVVAFMHPTSNWAHVQYSEIDMHCPKDGPRPIPLVTLASLQAMQARAEKAERERDEWKLIADLKAWADGLDNPAHPYVNTIISRAEAAEACVKELEEALAYAEKGLDMIHNGLMDPTRPRQSVGEVCAHFLSAARTARTGGSNG